MKYFRIFFLLILFSLSIQVVSAQSNKVSVTVTPSAYPDTVNKPAVVVESSQIKNSSQPEMNVRQESMTVTPASTTSIGTATAVTVQEKQNSTSQVKGKATVNYSEQKVEKSEAPSSGASVIDGTGSGSQCIKHPIVITVTKDLHYAVNNSPVDVNQIEAMLKSLIVNQNEPTAFLKIDKTVLVQKLIDLLNIGERLKIKKVLETF